jgi:transcriptional regulator with XRE-family HTH domain
VKKGSIGERLVELRKLLKLSQKEFAKTLELSNPYLSALESGKRPVHPRIINLIALTHGVNEAWLRDGTGPVFAKMDDARAKKALESFLKLDGFFQEFILRQMDFIIEFQKQEGGGKEKENILA